MKYHSGELISRASSNIALIKYWGKYPNQIPANASISYTLTESYTESRIKYSSTGNFKLNFTFEGKENQVFQEKLEKYLKSIEQYLPFISTTHFTIDSRNTFPHSSGIASSASSFAALALGLVQIEKETLNLPFVDFEKASFLARLGSGSACRSVYNGLVVWGKTDLVEGSSDEFAIPYPEKISSKFMHFQDSIALIHKGEKKVSSTEGHSLMNNHPYAEARFQQAHDNFARLQQALRDEDLFTFGEVIENEALSLHAMMMTSSPSYILMEANTLLTIQRIQAFRKDTGIPIFFTLDAGANVHILYPHSELSNITSFLTNSIKPLCVNGEIIHDKVKL